MIDSDNVLLLRPARTNSGFCLENLERPPYANKEDSNGFVVATIYYLAGSADSFIEFFNRDPAAKLTKAGASILAMFVTENHPNTFPALPVREGENVFVAFSRFANRETYGQLASSTPGRKLATKRFVLIKAEPEILLLSPT